MTRTTLAFVTLGLAFAPHANAGSTTWNEVGDAGQNGIGAAQIVLGAGPLGMIDGILTSGNDVDVYQILITDFASFNAQAVGPLDTMLWLFKADGTGQVSNDDYGGPLSRITSQGVSANGVYYIAMSLFSNSPRDASNVASFSSVSYPGPDNNQFMPNGAAGAFTQWTGDPDAGGGYQINFTGASFVPGPGSLACLVLAACFGRRRRRA